MPKIIVVGAGIAGLKAAADLIKARFQVEILEARNRIGGRAWTDTTTFDSVNFDLGCQILHNASVDQPNSAEFNPWVGEARKLGVKLIAEENDLYYQVETERQSPEVGRQIEAMQYKLEELIANAGQLQTDMSAMTAVQTEQFSPWFWPAAGQIAQLEESTGLNNFSAKDRSRAGGNGSNLLAPTGFGALVAQFGKSLENIIQLDTAVSSIAYSKTGVKVKTNKGVSSADGIIITVPTPVIANGSIKFSPPLPQSMQDAFTNLPLGHYMKIGLEFDENIFKTKLNDRVFTVPTSKDQPPIVFLTNLMGSNVVVAFIGGEFARQIQDMEAQNPGLASRFVLIRLRKMTGLDIEEHYTGRHVVTTWSNDPFSQGAYSYAVPGGSDGRQLLQNNNIYDRVFFAGEALSTEAYGTAHGAYLSGRTTAKNVIAHLPT